MKSKTNYLKSSLIVFGLLASQYVMADVTPSAQLLTRTQATQNGASRLLSILAAPFTNGYFLLLSFFFVAGFAVFGIALYKFKKEKNKPDEQQETAKYIWSMVIGVCLMGITAAIGLASDTLGFGNQLGGGVADEYKLQKNRTGYGIGQGVTNGGYLGDSGDGSEGR